MVILLGGSSHVGKTLVAHRLMERLGFPYISLDLLKMGFVRSGMTTLTAGDDWEMRYWMWPFVAEIAKTAIENRRDLILEGCYIPHNWKDSFATPPATPLDTSPDTSQTDVSTLSKADVPVSRPFAVDYMASIRSAFIVMSRNYIERNFNLIKEYANVIENRHDEGALDMERLVMCSEGFKEDCIANGTPFVEIDEAYDEDWLVGCVLKALGI